MFRDGSKTAPTVAIVLLSSMLAASLALAEQPAATTAPAETPAATTPAAPPPSATAPSAADASATNSSTASPPATTAATPDAASPPAGGATTAATPESKPAPDAEPNATSTPPQAATAPASPAPDAQSGATPAAGSTSTPPAATTATTDPSSPPATDASPAAPPAVAEAPAPPPDPVVAAVRARLADRTATSKSHPDDVAALAAFYGERKEGALWVDKDGMTKKGAALAGEIKRAADWGLETSAFEVPAAPAAGAPPEALAEAETKLAIAALKYARFARGGRLSPRSLSRILDLDPPVKDPKVVLADLASAEAPDAYLKGLNPKHEQFERLRQALLKARGPAEPEVIIDEALKIKIPRGNVVKPGAESPDIALLRQRLKFPADPGAKETVFDDKLVEALKAFQLQKGLAASGNLNNATRTALNSEGEIRRPAPGQNVQRLLVNMEKWRWMPEDLGGFYVWDNIPEFTARVIKDRKEVFKEKIIVGQPEWATPSFSASMKSIVFNPSWGVPDGIKMRELLPRLRSAGGGNFFDQLFGGGGGGAGVLRAYGLTAYRNGRVVDPDSVNWSAVDIRAFSFTQPPGPKNPLGFVKFLFPNKHDVYMHDTVQRELFAQSYRALSHGCMRVQNPRRFAEILIGEDRGLSPERASQAISAGGDVTLEKPVPVHVTYLTAIVDDAGKIAYYGDLYGHDSRITAALGRPMRFDTPRDQEPVETSSVVDDADPIIADPVSTADPVVPGKKKKGKERAAQKRETTINDLVSGALSGLAAN